MFGRKNTESDTIYQVTQSDNMVFAQPSLITDLLVYENEEKSMRYIKSDITLMNELGNNPNISPAVADELRIRGAMRDVSPSNNLSDAEILSTTKSRHTQSLVELQRFSEFLDAQIADTLDNEAKEALRAKYEAFLKGEPIEPKVEPTNPE